MDNPSPEKKPSFIKVSAFLLILLLTITFALRENILEMGAGNGNKPMIQLALLLGADIETKYTDIYMTPLMIASIEGHDNTVDLLVERGANLSARDLWGQSPLHYALRRQHMSTMDTLIAAGADVNSDSLLEMAIVLNNAEAVALLIDSGAKVSTTNMTIGTIIQQNKDSDNEEIMEMLRNAMAQNTRQGESIH